MAISPTTVTLAALGALAAGAVARRRHTLSAVSPQLRTPKLWLPLAVTNRLVLSLGRRMFSGGTEPVSGVTVDRHSVPGGQDVYVYEPSQRTCDGGALLWIHGGGTIFGSPEADHELCSRFARDLGILVVNITYRLAPEHPFPAGHDDCYTALRWLHDNAAQFGVDPARIAIGGASAGGGLAAATAQRATDQDLPLRFQLLVYPMLDDRTVLRRDHAGRGRLIWTPRSNRYAWTSYLGHRPGAREPLPYAAASRRTDLAGLPPAWIGVGDLDLFYEEDVDYARRLQAVGVPVDLRVEPGMYHGAENEVRPTAPAMQAFEQAMFDALATALKA